MLDTRWSLAPDRASM